MSFLDYLFAAQFVAGILFMLWAWRAERPEWHTKITPRKDILRDRSGFITPELLQAILGIALMILLALAMVGGFADEPRW
jgi:hypothetical protein